MIALMDPKDSWVAKWQSIQQYKAGLYAISVSGDLPQILIRQLRDKEIEYKNRDVSQKN
jgi:transcription elongation factor SPT4